MSENGWRALFTRITDLVQKLQIARRELQLEATVVKLDKWQPEPENKFATDNPGDTITDAAT